MIGDPLDQWVREKIDARNEDLAESKNLMISLDPEIAKVFNSSNFISCKYQYNSKEIIH